MVSVPSANCIVRVVTSLSVLLAPNLAFAKPPTFDDPNRRGDIPSYRALVPFHSQLPAVTDQTSAGDAPKARGKGRLKRFRERAREQLKTARKDLADKVFYGPPYDTSKDPYYKQSTIPGYDRVLDPKVKLPGNVAMVPYGYYPSSWERFLNWNSDASMQMRKRLHDAATGERPFYDFKRVGIETAKELPGAALTLGAVLGVAAVYNLWRDYPDNPVAWTRYYETMTDPVGWMSITAFMMAFAPFVKWMNSDAVKAAGMAKQMPIFMVGLATAGLVQAGVAQIAKDDDVRACLGFTSLAKFRKIEISDSVSFARDYEACDRAANKIYNGELSTDIVIKSLPSIAGLALAGTTMFRLMNFMQTRLPVERFLRVLGVVGSASPVQLALRGAYTLTTAAALIFLTEAPTEFLTRPWETWLLSSLHGRGPVYAKNIATAESDLFEAWERARASGWRDTNDLVAMKSVCYEFQRVNPLYDCSKSGELDFEGVLQAHLSLQQKWRSLQLRGTLQAWTEWTEKVGAYRESYAQAKVFYAKAVEKLLYTKTHPNAAPDDPNLFNQKNMSVVTSETFSGPIRSMFARVGFFQSQDGVFGHLSTPRAEELFAASLACGPDATGKRASGAWDSVRQFAGNWLTKNYAPADVVDNSKGLRAAFRPPRIVRPLDGTSESACEIEYNLDTNKLVALPYFFLGSYVAPTVDEVTIRANGKLYKGVFEYIKANVRPDIVTPENQNQFEAWWAAYVTPKDQAFAAQLQKEYATIVDDKFTPTLNNHEYYWCETSPIARTQLGGYLSRLSELSGDCSSDRTQRLASGVLNSLRDQVRLYVAMMVDLYIQNSHVLGQPTTNESLKQPTYPVRTAAVENAVFMPAKRLLDAYDTYAKVMVNSSDDQVMRDAQLDLTAKLTAFVKITMGNGSTGFTRAEEPFTLTLEKQTVWLRGTKQKVEMGERSPLPILWMNKLKLALLATLADWEAYAKIPAMTR